MLQEKLLEKCMHKTLNNVAQIARLSHFGSEVQYMFFLLRFLSLTYTDVASHSSHQLY